MAAAKRKKPEERELIEGIGGADEFYRARIIEVDEIEPEPFEWRDDIFLTRNRPPRTHEHILYRVQVVQGDSDVSLTLAEVDDLPGAEALLAEVKADLGQMTKHRFDEKYLGA